METDVDHIHALLEYDTTERICDIVKELKQKSTYYLWEQFMGTVCQCAEKRILEKENILV